MKEPPPPRREPEATSGARPPGAAPPGPAAPHGVCGGGGLRPAVPPHSFSFWPSLQHRLGPGVPHPGEPSWAGLPGQGVGIFLTGT